MLKKNILFANLPNESSQEYQPKTLPSQAYTIACFPSTIKFKTHK